MKFYSFKVICEECKQEASLSTEIGVWNDPVTVEVKATCSCGNEEIL